MQRLAHGYCSNLGPLLRQSGGGEQPIAAIVAGPGKQHDGSILERQILVIQHAGSNMAVACAAMRISGTPLSSSGRSISRTVPES